MLGWKIHRDTINRYLQNQYNKIYMEDIMHEIEKTKPHLQNRKQGFYDQSICTPFWLMIYLQGQSRHISQTQIKLSRILDR